MFMHDPQHTGRSEYSGPSKGRVKWKFAAFAREFSPVVNLDNVVYVCACDEGHHLCALNPDGGLRWKSGSSICSDSSSPLISYDGTIYVGSGGFNFYALNQDGVEKRSYATKGYFVSSPAIGLDGTIYAASLDAAYLYAFHPDGGSKWKFKIKNVHTFSPAVGIDGTVFVSDCLYLYAFNPNGTLRWKIGRIGRSGRGFSICGSPAIGCDETIYVRGSYSSKKPDLSGYYLLAIHPDGKLKWKFKVDEQAHSLAAIGSDETIYLSNMSKFKASEPARSYLYAINPDGTLKWKVEINDHFTSSVIDSEGTLYISSYFGRLYAIASDGTLKWKLEIGDSNSSPAIGSNGVLYVGTEDYLYAIE